MNLLKRKVKLGLIPMRKFLRGNSEVLLLDLNFQEREKVHYDNNARV